MNAWLYGLPGRVLLSEQTPFGAPRAGVEALARSARRCERDATSAPVIGSAPIREGRASPLRVATGGYASDGSGARPRRSPAPANRTARDRLRWPNKPPLSGPLEHCCPSPSAHAPDLATQGVARKAEHKV